MVIVLDSILSEPPLRMSWMLSIFFANDARSSARGEMSFSVGVPADLWKSVRLGSLCFLMSWMVVCSTRWEWFRLCDMLCLRSDTEISSS